MTLKELVVPPDAASDPDAFEMLRLWAAGGQLHVVIQSGLVGRAEDFGELLADLLEHAARLYSERDARPLAECRLAIMHDLAARFATPKASVQGRIGG